MNLIVWPDQMAVCKTDCGSQLPLEISPAVVWSVTRTKDELSIVLPEKFVQTGWIVEGGWRIIQVAGMLDFNMTGVLASLCNPLAQAGISIFALSTYNTDYIMVKGECLEHALSVLNEAGFQITRISF